MKPKKKTQGTQKESPKNTQTTQQNKEDVILVFVSRRTQPKKQESTPRARIRRNINQ
jgi:hypothetical protein